MFLKEEFENKIKKCVNMNTFDFYNKLWEASGLKSIDKFVNLLNIKEIPEDINLKKLRLFAKKEIPKLEKKIKNLELKLKDMDQTIKWLSDLQMSTDIYKYKKLEIKKDIKKVKLKLSKLKNDIK